MDTDRFLTATLRQRPEGAAISAILAATVATADPYGAVQRHLVRHENAHEDWIAVGTTRYDLRRYRRVIVLAVGKAATPMAQATLDVLASRVTAGLVVPKATPGQPAPRVAHLEVIPSSHPIPDERSAQAGERALALLRSAPEDDLVLVLLSGGGSALMTAPRDDLTLGDMRDLTDLLLASGATINEVNALRRRCDDVKGGGLLQAAYPAQVAVLVLSDVLGDDLQAIASGPFVAGGDPDEVRRIVEHYDLQARLPRRIASVLAQPPAAVDPALAQHVQHTIVANVEAAIEGARAAAEAHGFAVEVLSTALRGEARTVGASLARDLVASQRQQPFCLLAGGETTVTLRGSGRGGRNQELALSTVELLRGRSDLVLVALATDGGDGPTDAAGAVVDGFTAERGQARGLDPADFLRRNDAYHYFDALGDLLRPGQTETNVNDVTFLFGTGRT